MWDVVFLLSVNSRRLTCCVAQNATGFCPLPVLSLNFNELSPRRAAQLCDFCLHFTRCRVIRAVTVVVNQRSVSRWLCVDILELAGRFDTFNGSIMS